MLNETDVEAVAKLLRHPDHWPSAPYLGPLGLTGAFDADTLAAARAICELLTRRMEAR